MSGVDDVRRYCQAMLTSVSATRAEMARDILDLLDPPVKVSTGLVDMVASDAAYCDVRAVLNQDGPDPREITDATARTIAGWWASSGAVGRHLATLSTGGEVTVTELHSDIAATRHTSGMADIDRRALDCLATWAMAQARVLS